MKEKDKEDKAEIIKETSESVVVPEAEVEVVSQSKRTLSENATEVIDLREVFKKLWHKKHYFFISLPVAFILSCIYILCVPRYYKSDLKLAPEWENPISGGGALNTIAANFGFGMGDAQTSDAISPMLYPDLMEDNGFVVNLFDVRVSTADDSIKTTYYDYLLKHQKRAPWAKTIAKIKAKFTPKPEEHKRKRAKGIQHYDLTKQQSDITELIRSNINISVDKKDAVITINVKDQDPLICKTMADTVKTKLQQFITEYRTNKARIDVEYYRKLTREAWEKYRVVRDAYVRNTDANTDVILASVKSKVEDLENDMQLKYTAYTTMQAQLQEAEAKLQARTPAFTLLKGSIVPIKPAGPKRMIFVVGMLFLTVLFTIIYILRRGIVNLMLGKN